MSPDKHWKHKVPKLEDNLATGAGLLTETEIDTGIGTGMGLLGNDSAVHSLISALEDEREDVRRTAAWALGEGGNESAINTLIEHLGTEEGVVREAVVEALVKIGDPATKALIKAVQDPETRDAVIIVLERIRDTILRNLDAKEG